MADGYTRQALADIQPLNDINAEDFNAEFNAIQSAFDNSVGHDHGGLTPGTGAPISLSSAVGGVLPIANGGTGIATSLVTTVSGSTQSFIGTINATTGVEDNGNRVLSLSNLPALEYLLPSDPTGTTSTTLVMMGLAATLIPTTTGRVMITISGAMYNATVTDGVKIAIYSGPIATVPANGAALVGSVRSNVLVMGNPTGAVNGQVPFSITGMATGLTLSAEIWIDLAVAATTGGTATVLDLTVVAVEV